MDAQTLESVTAKAAEIIADITGVVLPERPEKPLGDIHLLDDLDIDSLSLVEVVVAIEEEFGIKIEDSETKTLTTLGQVSKLVLQRTQGK
ncbi:phosphopantetheine-binding protein [Streptomyces chartreusis]|uniref:phosphopantetheine-binding protein n=1 Tax=Streptomyces chartreusis TaxID=1969 RepID=UPI00340EA8D0